MNGYHPSPASVRAAAVITAAAAATLIPDGRIARAQAAATRPAITGIERTEPNSRAAHLELVAKARSGKIDLYFLGDSITRRWGTSDPAYAKFLENWRANFFGWNAGNFGWGADGLRNILWRIRNGELDGVNPKAIVLLAGTNDVGGRPPADAAAADAKVVAMTDAFDAVLATCREKAPGATIVVTGILPRDDNPGGRTVIDRVNAHLAARADGRSLRYININEKLTDASGRLLPGVAVDGLHLDVKGYQIWADGLKPTLTEVLGPPRATDEAPPPTGDPSAKQR